MSFIPIPAIDLMEGRVVRLRRGVAAEKTVYSDDPAAIARGFESQGARRIHVVDLDGAFGGAPRNLDAIRRIRSAVQCEIELGGGLRTENDVAGVFALGINDAILGTSAVRDRDLARRMADRFGERLIVGIDARDGFVAVEGWIETSNLSQIDFARELEVLGIATIIATDIATDGMMTGPNLGSLSALAQSTRMRVIASGGVRNVEDFQAIQELRCPNLIGAIVGRAVYEGQFDLRRAAGMFGR